MSRVWSRYQDAIFEHVANGNGNGVVIARAGSGKTTTIEEAVRRVPAGKSVIVLAFNNAIAKELAARLPRTVSVMTTHTCGMRVCERMFPGTVLLKSKVADLIAERYPSLEKWHIPAICKGVSLAKNTLVTSREEIAALIDDYSIELFRLRAEVFVDMVIDLLSLSAEVTHVVDFDDMIWLPVKHNVRPAGADWVFVDETQDLNRAQIDLVLRMVKPGGRVLAVGDDRQAIYGFRGADRLAVPRVKEALSAVTMPLSVTYRCSCAVVREAQRIVPDLEPAPGAPEGNVSNASFAQCIREAQPGDFILSRSNAPLVSLTLSFLGAGRPAHMLGRDLGEGLVKLITKSRAESVAQLIEWVDDWAEKQAARLLRKGKNPEPPRDQAECLSRIAEGEASVSDVAAKVRRLFDEEATDEDRITLSSTHKAKGLERDRVWLLKSTYMRRSQYLDPVEEENLYYVATTRARSDLRLVS